MQLKRELSRPNSSFNALGLFFIFVQDIYIYKYKRVTLIDRDWVFHLGRTKVNALISLSNSVL